MVRGSRKSAQDKLALLVNIRSRKARKESDFLDRLQSAFGEIGPLIMSNSPGELPSAMDDVLRANPQILFICGGDGTLRQTLTQLVEAYGRKRLPRIAILRGGTMNTVATSVGIIRPPVEHLLVLLDRIRRKLPLATTQRYLLRVNHQYGFIFGVGGFSRFIEHYTSHPDPTPRYGFTLVTQTVLSAMVRGSLAETMFQPFPVSLWRDGQPWYSKRDVTNIAASTVRHIGFGFKPFYGAEGAPHEFGLLVFHTSPRSLLFDLPKMYRGEPISDPKIEQLPAKKVLIKLQKAMRPMLDGDLLKASKEFTISTGPSLDLVLG